jgi:hypothetical protein
LIVKYPLHSNRHEGHLQSETRIKKMRFRRRIAIFIEKVG